MNCLVREKRYAMIMRDNMRPPGRVPGRDRRTTERNPWVERASRPAPKIPLKMGVLGPITPASSVKLKTRLASANARLQSAADPFCFSSLFEPCFFLACVAQNCASLPWFIPVGHPPCCFHQPHLERLLRLGFSVIKLIRLIPHADLIGLPKAPPTPQTSFSHLSRSPLPTLK
ncbi:hypothetical protein BJY01DRAFT_131509 [Aspergillus pseudoustus]|uniref:Uncharacterized protein n=1 Tax=Aspergillus pseudoustus TaxID=1810923 RepID=A0ABR4INA2_9EURO